MGLSQHRREILEKLAELDPQDQVGSSVILPRPCRGQLLLKAHAMDRFFKRISTQQARELLASPPITVVDVRDPGSFQASHIDGAVNVSEATVGEVLDSTPKDQTVLIYCYHGISSQAYAQLFADFGFKNVYSMNGGYTQWAAEQARS
jgi:thiosulfate sulfurtransferase